MAAPTAGQLRRDRMAVCGKDFRAINSASQMDGSTTVASLGSRREAMTEQLISEGLDTGAPGAVCPLVEDTRGWRGAGGMRHRGHHLPTA